MKERENAKKRAITDLNAPMVLEISYSKVRNLSKMDVAILLMLLHFHFNMTSQMQYKEKMTVQYLRNILFDLFEISQAVRT